MSLPELFLVAVGLSMDAFAVAICKGLALPKISLNHAAIVGGYFGFFQAAMPLIGFFLGSQFADNILAYDHWIAFVLLLFIGGKMIMESRENEEQREEGNPLALAKMLPMAIATSIDALAVGVSFAFLRVDIVPAVSFIGITTLLLSMAGVYIGNVFGVRYKSKAELAGGVILIGMGLRILLDHLGA